ncbi:replication protein C, IncQ-type [Aeromonas caviae]|uniref:replication protein C, IncQ-type n=1 Tax=Aeromonas caviae TaxID=648 RepID=UPI0038D038B7
MTSPNNKVSFALSDPATAMASLFRPVCRGRRPLGLQVDMEFNGGQFMFTCWQWLDTVDQSILLALIGLAGMDSSNITAETSGEIGKQLWTDLKPEDIAKEGRGLVVTTSKYAILEAAGLSTSGPYYDRLEDCLYRLMQVGCRVKLNGKHWGMNLLSYAVNTDDGQVYVALNQRFAEAIGGQHVNISLDERRQLNSSAAQVLHGYLSATIHFGKHGVWTGIDSLAERIWGTVSKNESTVRTRRATLLAACNEIQSLGWRVDIRGHGARQLLLFTRPALIRHHGGSY